MLAMGTKSTYLGACLLGQLNFDRPFRHPRKVLGSARMTLHFSNRHLCPGIALSNPRSSLPADSCARHPAMTTSLNATLTGVTSFSPHTFLAVPHGDSWDAMQTIVVPWTAQFVASWVAFLLFMKMDYDHYVQGTLSLSKLPTRHPLKPFWEVQLRMIPLVLYNQLVVWPLMYLLFIWPVWSQTHISESEWSRRYGWWSLPFAWLALAVISDQMWYWLVEDRVVEGCGERFTLPLTLSTLLQGPPAHAHTLRLEALAPHAPRRGAVRPQRDVRARCRVRPLHALARPPVRLCRLPRLLPCRLS